MRGEGRKKEARKKEREKQMFFFKKNYLTITYLEQK